MANLIWAKVYYQDQFAGYLREEPGERSSFAYDSTYLSSGLPPIAHTLPIRVEPYITQSGLHPFFDNLVAEGWLEIAQTRLIGKRQASRFELLVAFGQDCAGAVSVIDPEQFALSEALIDMNDPKELAMLTSRSSLSGIQPKLTLVERNGELHPTKNGELSTHIAKFQSLHHDDLVMNEYLTTIAFRALLPDDDVVDLRLGEVHGIDGQALIIKRFDRAPGNKRIHFEEFAQLLGRPSKAKYDGSHKEMADFIRDTKGCLPLEIYKLYARILAGILLGNTDMHLKNFAMLHTDDSLRLTPSYDQVAATIYDYKTMALAIGGAHNMRIGDLKPSNIIKLAEEFQLPKGATQMVFEQLLKNKEAAYDAISSSPVKQSLLKDKLIEMMEKRWNGTFNLIGQSLLKKP